MGGVGLANLTISFCSSREIERPVKRCEQQQQQLPLSFSCWGKLCLTNIIEDKSVASCLGNTATSGLEGNQDLWKERCRTCWATWMLGRNHSCCTHPPPSLSLVSWQGWETGWGGSGAQAQHNGKMGESTHFYTHNILMGKYNNLICQQITLSNLKQ